MKMDTYRSQDTPHDARPGAAGGVRAQPQAQWAPCPICGEPDMRREVYAEGHSVIFCTNSTCRSNGGTFDMDPKAGASGSMLVALTAGCPDDLRAHGWAVAAHHDYQLNGVPHTSWLFTRGDRFVKGEGRTDAEALDQIREQLPEIGESRPSCSAMNEGAGLFKWDEKYSLNIIEIDRQHQKLFALVNELYEAAQKGCGHEVTGKVLKSVLDYTVYHFDFEEKLLHEYAHPAEAAHRAEHAMLTQQAIALVQKHQLGDGLVTMATLKFLSDWLNDHILGSDKEYAPLLIAKGAR
jgi:hemerythrin